MSDRPAEGGFIGETVRFQGEMSGQEGMVIDGTVEGTIELGGKLTIGPNGKVHANVKASEVVVQGSVHCNVEATTRLTIHRKANIVGDVKTAGITIEDGAFFKGGIDIVRPE